QGRNSHAPSKAGCLLVAARCRPNHWFPPTHLAIAGTASIEWIANPASRRNQFGRTIKNGGGRRMTTNFHFIRPLWLLALLPLALLIWPSTVNRIPHRPGEKSSRQISCRFS